MAISQNALEQILGNAKALCSPEGDKMVNSYKVSGMMNFNDPDPASFSDPYEGFGDADYDETYETKSSLATNAPIVSENKLRTSNIPDSIKESFAKQQIDTSSFSNVSVLDRLSEASKQKLAGTIKVEKKAPINEQTKQQYNGSFDYTALKAVMKECIAEYFSAHPLNENTLRQISLKEGKINLVDNKGNIYGADLVFKKNINEDKNK